MARMGGLFLFFVFVLLPRARDLSRAFGFFFLFLFLFFFSFHCPGPETCLRPFFIFLSFLFCFILFYFTGPERRSWSLLIIFIFYFFTSQGLRRFYFFYSQGLRHVLSQALVLSFLLFFLLTGLEMRSWASFQALFFFVFFSPFYYAIC